MPDREKPKRLGARPCPVCARNYEPYRDSQFACSRPCREKAVRRGVANPKATLRDLTCRRCGCSFTATWSGLGLQPSCPGCTQRVARESATRRNVARRVETDADRREINLRDLLRRRYGLTLERYQEMLDRQDGCCAICDSPPDPNGVKAASRLHVDHDHATGANRELLCTRCNQGVGFFRDDPKLLRKAADYIERHREGA